MTSPFSRGGIDLAVELAYAAQQRDHLSALRRSRRVARVATATDDPDRLLDDLMALVESDSLLALMAIESIGGLRTERATVALGRLLSHESPLVRRHAAWRLGTRAPDPGALPALADLLLDGGLAALHAHCTLRRWLRRLPVDSVDEIVGLLCARRADSERLHLVRLLGALRAEQSGPIIAAVALDPDESNAIRVAAVSALAEWGDPCSTDVLAILALDRGPVGESARCRRHGWSAREATAAVDDAEYSWHQLPEVERALRRDHADPGAGAILRIGNDGVSSVAGLVVARSLGLLVDADLGACTHVRVARQQEEGRLDRQEFLRREVDEGLFFRLRHTEEVAMAADRLVVSADWHALGVEKALGLPRGSVHAHVVVGREAPQRVAG